MCVVLKKLTQYLVRSAVYDMWNDFNKNKCNANVFVSMFTATAFIALTNQLLQKLFGTNVNVNVYQSHSIDISFTCLQSININTLFGSGIQSKQDTKSIDAEVEKRKNWSDCNVREIEPLVVPLFLFCSLLFSVLFCSSFFFCFVQHFELIRSQQTMHAVEQWKEEKIK